MIATILVAALAAATLEADLRAVAALKGEPSIVSAAGVTRDERPILTLENPSAFDVSSTKRRAVIYAAGGNERTAAAVLALVRWMKTRAPASLRRQWILSALPSADFDPADDKSFARWARFQAADVVIEVTDQGAHPIGVDVPDVAPWVIRTPVAPDALGSALRAAGAGRSRARAAIAARVQREPLAIARVLARRYPESPGISYIPALAWITTLRLATITGDLSLRDKVMRQVRPWLSGEQRLFGERIQLTAVAGTMVFAEIGSHDPAAMPLATEGSRLAAAERAPGVAQYGGGWTDDMFMSAAILARTRQLDVAARLLTAYTGRLQRSDGLFNHTVDGPVAWGRGNGFAAFGLMEALTALPPSHPARAPLLEIYRRHMTAVKAHQAPDGSWGEVIDEPGSYREESATAMLMTAMARGIRLGWIDRSYLPAVERAWRALAAHVVDDGTVVDVCASTGGGPTKRYYLDRPAITGADDRGGAMALVAAMEMYDLGNSRQSAAR